MRNDNYLVAVTASKMVAPLITSKKVRFPPHDLLEKMIFGLFIRLSAISRNGIKFKKSLRMARMPMHRFADVL